MTFVNLATFLLKYILCPVIAFSFIFMVMILVNMFNRYMNKELDTLGYSAFVAMCAIYFVMGMAVIEVLWGNFALPF